VENILVPVDQRIHNLCKVLASEIHGRKSLIEAIQYSLKTKVVEMKA
jgi:hypothetical protein